MSFRTENEETVQTNHGPEHPLLLEVYDLRNRENAIREMEARADDIQGSLNLESGPLMKLGLFHLDDGDRLLVVIHHLVIDTVSWRILFEDIDLLYRQYREHRSPETFQLPLKTDSFRLWSRELSRYADTERFLREKTFWEAMESIHIPVIKTDNEVEGSYVMDTEILTFRLSETDTEQLLTRVNNAFGTEINDILLTALALAVKRTFGRQQLLTALEGHGREEILEEVDVKRTVGWFTSVFPVVINVAFPDDPVRQLKEVKETLRRIPNKGIGYGIMKYLTSGKHKTGLDFKLNPQVSFNYFGQFDADVTGLSFAVARESTGNMQSSNREREFLLDVGGMVADGRLEMNVAYNKRQFRVETIRGLLDAFQAELRQLIILCAARKTVELTPSDLGFKGMTIDQLETLFEKIEHRDTWLYKENVKDIYGLSSMQEGMFFHAMYDPSSSLYFLQTSYRADEEMDIVYVEKSLNELVKRYDVLRTVFVQVDGHNPLQVVLKERYVDFFYEDISGKEDRDDFLARYKEKDGANLFDLSKDVLMRVAVIKSGPANYDFVWSFHHILMDGWCIGILISEYFEIYNALLDGRSHQLPEVTPYRTFIQWLEKQDHETSRRYWKTYLEGCSEQTSVPKLKGLKTKQEGYSLELTSYRLGPERSERINRLAAECQVTLSTMFQSIWAVLLGAYNNKQDLVFGAVVSGRPSEIEGVETLLGSFMTTIPVRIRFQDDTTFSDLIRRVQREAVDSEPHHHYSLAEIQAQTPLKQNLFDHIFVFENYPRIEEISRLSNIQSLEQSNYTLNFIIMPGDGLNLIFTYNGNLYDKEFIEKTASHVEEVLDTVLKNPAVPVKDIVVSQYYSAAQSTIHKDDGADFEF